MAKARQINKLTLNELENHISLESSWHQDYSDSNYIYFGNIPTPILELDLLKIFSQYGVITDIKLFKSTDQEDYGRSKGFGFLKYEDWKSTVLAIDNFNGIELSGKDEKTGKILTKTIVVDHANYHVKMDEDGNEVLDEWDLTMKEELKKDFVDFKENGKLLKEDRKESDRGSHRKSSRHRSESKRGSKRHESRRDSRYDFKYESKTHSRTRTRSNDDKYKDDKYKYNHQSKDNDKYSNSNDHNSVNSEDEDDKENPKNLAW